MSDEIKFMDIAEFRALGLLQEVNRSFFHPLGLALSVEIDEDGNERLQGLWDGRDDPEGWLYVKEYGYDAEKVRIAHEFMWEKYAQRLESLGFVIQQVVGRTENIYDGDELRGAMSDRRDEQEMKEVNGLYELFWKEIVERRGEMAPDLVKRELFDFYILMKNARKVYSHVTYGRISKLNTDGDAINKIADECCKELCLEDSEDD